MTPKTNDLSDACPLIGVHVLDFTKGTQAVCLACGAWGRVRRFDLRRLVKSDRRLIEAAKMIGLLRRAIPLMERDGHHDAAKEAAAVLANSIARVHGGVVR